MNALQKTLLVVAVTWTLKAAAQSGSDSFNVKFKTVDEQGRPVPSATVQQYAYSEAFQARGELEVQQQKTSDANGEVTFQLARTFFFPQGPLLFVARKPGLATAWMQFRTGIGEPPPLVLTSPSFLAGRVLDEAGKPVSNAVVSVGMAFCDTAVEGGRRFFNLLSGTVARDLFTTHTDANGRFRLEAFSTNGSAVLVAEAPGKALRAQPLEIISPDAMPWHAGQKDIQLTLEPAGSVEGKIVAEGPISSAQVTLVPNGPGAFGLGNRPSTKALADGTFRLNNLPAGSYRAQAVFGTNATPDWVAETIPANVESGQTTRGLQLTAIRGGILEVAVHGSKDSKPIDGVGVNLFKDGFQTGLNADSSGVARFRLAPGTYQVSAFKQGWLLANMPGTVEANRTNRLEIEMTPSRKLAGIVRAPDGQPAPDVNVQVVGDFSFQQAILKTGTDGKFELEQNSQRFAGNNATPCLLVRDPEHNLAFAQDFDDGTDNIEVRLAPAVSFVARVESDGKPLTNVTANLVFMTGNMGMALSGLAARTATPGVVEIRALPPGRRYSLQLTAPGYGSKFMELADKAEEPKRVELDVVELKRTDHKLAGKVVDTEDKPVAGAMVHVSGDGQPNANTRTDTQGRFSFDVCEGAIRLFANTPRGGFANVSAEAGDTNVLVKLENRSLGFGGGPAKPEKLKGTVTDASGKPVAGADVRVFQAQMPNGGKTDSNGTFSVTYILQPWQRQNGKPLLLVRDRAHNLAAAQELLDENTNLTVQLETGLSVKGHVVSADGKPLADANVNLLLQANRMGGLIEDQPVKTDSRGGFKFTALPVGQDYTLFANTPGYSQKRQHLDPDWDKNVVDLPPIVLRVPNQLIAGQVVDAKEKPLSAVHVQVEADDQPEAFMQTDSKGRFHFKVCEGPVRMFASGPLGFAQTTAEAGDTNVVIMITDRVVRGQPVVRRKPANVSALKGKPLPDLATLGFEGAAAPAGGPVLLCLLDVQQRPSRRMARLLTAQWDTLRQAGVTVLGAQTVPTSDEDWNDWKDSYRVRFPLSRLREKTDSSKWATGLQELPWLILTDNKGVVLDEGFPLEQLEAKLQDLQRVPARP